MNDTVLNIQNVTQKIGIDDVKVKTFGQKLMEKVIFNNQEELPNGNIKITLILDPKIVTEDKNNE